MTLVQTLAERKRARVEEIRAGLDVLRKKLTEYGRAHGGKFMMFGSAVNGGLHYDSDVDILVDFDASASAPRSTSSRRLALRSNCMPTFSQKHGARKNSSPGSHPGRW